MAFTITQWPDSNIVVVTGSGSGSIEESEAVLDALAAQTLIPNPRGVLFDFRLLEYIPTTVEARRMATRYGAFGVRYGVRMAYLTPPGAQYGIARMVQSLTEGFGVTSAVFTCPDAAMTWLNSDVTAMGA